MYTKTPCGTKRFDVSVLNNVETVQWSATVKVMTISPCYNKKKNTGRISILLQERYSPKFTMHTGGKLFLSHWFFIQTRITVDCSSAILKVFPRKYCHKAYFSELVLNAPQSPFITLQALRLLGRHVASTRQRQKPPSWFFLLFKVSG